MNCIYTCMCTRAHLQTHTRTHAHIYACTPTWCIYAHIYTSKIPATRQALGAVCAAPGLPAQEGANWQVARRSHQAQWSQVQQNVPCVTHEPGLMHKPSIKFSL